MNRPKYKRAVLVKEIQQPSLSDHEQLVAKQAGYEQAIYQAWFGSSLEKTRSVFTLASAGIGLSLTLVFGDNNKNICSWAPIWLLLSIVVFAISASLCIGVFEVNRRLISKIVRDDDFSGDEGLVKRLGVGSQIFFGVGLVFLVFSAIAKIWL